MSDDQQGRRPSQDAVERLLQVFRIEGGDPLVEDDDDRPLEESPRHEQPAALAA